jgi:thiamine-phosphate pyrophosphorylase
MSVMDARLVAWARAVKSRLVREQPQHGLPERPVLWLFTDEARLPDPRRAVAALPKRLCGVVLRHDGDPRRAELGRDLAAICRRRGLILVVADDPRLAARLHAGLHLRAARAPLIPPGVRPLTSSAHGLADLRRARRARVSLAFLSPAFPTLSHPGQSALGIARWSGMARRTHVPVAALGGVTGATATALPKLICAGAGAIGALRAIPRNAHAGRQNRRDA